MEDLKILKHARHYIAAMADGINPLTGEYAPPNDTISEERIQKCCRYVKEILDKLIESGGSVKPQKVPFSITPQQLTEVQVSAEPIGINEIAKRINSVTPKNMTGISGTKIASWLAENGYLTVETFNSVQPKTRKILNERSRALGITSIHGINPKTGEMYEKLLYAETAQRFILNNLYKITEKQ